MLASSLAVPNNLPNRRRSGFIGGPIVVIACCSIILVLVGATIVIALIPIYLPTQDASQGACTRRFYVIGNFDGSIGNDGALNDEARTRIARTLEPLIGLSTVQLQIQTAVVATTPNGRKRRLLSFLRIRRGQTPSGIQRVYIVFTIPPAICRRYILPTTSFTTTVTFPFNGNTVAITITVAISETPITIPPTLGPTTVITTTAASSIATTASTTMTTTSTTTVTTTFFVTGGVDG